MNWAVIHRIHELHMRFIADFFYACMLKPPRPESSLTSFVYLIFSFIVIHRALHSRRNFIPSLQIYFYRELGFQWSFFYATRIWLTVIKATNWVLSWSARYIKDLHEENKALWMQHIYLEYVLLFLLTLMGFVPMFIFVISYIMDIRNIPNFLMWVGDDQWVRSEIGISGHYLDRPPTFVIPKRKEYAYRMKRSVSVECNSIFPKMKQPLRNCKSLTVINFS